MKFDQLMKRIKLQSYVQQKDIGVSDIGSPFLSYTPKHIYFKEIFIISFINNLTSNTCFGKAWSFFKIALVILYSAHRFSSVAKQLKT